MACIMMMPKSATIPDYIEWVKTSMAGQKRGILDDEAYSSLRLGPESISTAK
ncbi:hypothetical protein V8E51_014964 [Hyaloscypha variabilis]